MLKLAFRRADPANFVSREIAKRDEPYRYSHVELVFDNGEAFSSRAFASGSESKRNGTYFQHLSPDPAHWDVVDLPVSPEEEAAAKAFCVDNDGEDYDFDGVGSFIAFLLHEDPNKWFCSEVCAAAIQAAGYLRELIPGKTSPNLLYTAAVAQFPPQPK